MIVVRDIFHLKFGKAREAKELLKEGIDIIKGTGYAGTMRAMTDLTGRSYTLVMESEIESLGKIEEELKKSFADSNWQEWYKKFTPFCESGEREIYTLIDL
jgi:hypothetical protein